MAAPVLATTGNLVDGPPPVLNNQATLFGGNEDLFSGLRVGGRFGLGYWFSDCHIRGIDAEFMFLGNISRTFAANSGQVPTIVRPFNGINLPPDLLSGEVVTAPGRLTGSIAIDASSDFLSTEVNYRRHLFCNPLFRMDLLVGFRYANLRESLEITERFDALQPIPIRGRTDMTVASGIVTDRFATDNDFYGANVGFTFERKFGRWFVDGRAKVAMGVNYQTNDIRGSQNLTLATPAGTILSANGGLLALDTNSGTNTRSHFSVIPEFGINLGYHLTPRLRLTVGYSFLYWANVIRPGTEIDSTVNAQRIPNLVQLGRLNTAPARPTVPFNQEGFWAQGINLGIQYKW
jgi:hypothetical protein